MLRDEGIARVDEAGLASSAPDARCHQHLQRRLWGSPWPERKAKALTTLSKLLGFGNCISLNEQLELSLALIAASNHRLDFPRGRHLFEVLSARAGVKQSWSHCVPRRCRWQQRGREAQVGNSGATAARGSQLLIEQRAVFIRCCPGTRGGHLTRPNLLASVLTLARLCQRSCSAGHREQMASLKQSKCCQDLLLL